MEGYWFGHYSVHLRVYGTYQDSESWAKAFSDVKHPVLREQRTDTIYSILCNDCDHKYIGQTKRQSGTRLKKASGGVLVFLQKEELWFVRE